jgi:DNA helicase-2/ATP-dependent DNA helicase PcrA
MSQDDIDKLFAEVDTEANALKLMGDLGINEKYPHYIPQGTYRNVVNLRYFGDGRKTLESPWHAHRVDLWSSNSQLAKTLAAAGYNPRIRSRGNWRVGINRLHYDDIHESAQKLSESVGNADIVVGAFLVDKKDSPLAPKFNLIPASQLHPTMIVAVEKNGRIIEDEIIEISHVPYKGNVYDFEVENLHNYLAGGVVVHNSVYRWRGADYRNVRRFQDDHPDALTVLLEQNYRSTQLILDAAMAVIDKNKGRTRKQLFTEREGGVKIQGYEAYNEEEESLYIIQTISTLTKREKLDPNDVAIMYRTNAQSRALEDSFVRAGLPYRIVGAQRFYGRREVKDLIAFLRLVHNPADSVSLMRVINVPPRSLGAKTIETLQAAADSASVPVSAIIRDLGLNRLNSGYASQFKGKAGAALSDFGQMLNEWIAFKESATPAKLVDRILADTDYRRYINDGTDEGEDRWENVMELRGVAAEADNLSLASFLEEVALVADADTLNEGAGPTLLTLHAAKGLEFPVVFITGLNDGVLPHQRSLEDAEEMAEERRLMYVGVTRAKDRLFLTRSHRITSYGSYEVASPSRFLADIPQSLLTGTFTLKKFADESAYARMTSWDSDSSDTRRGEVYSRSNKSETYKAYKREAVQSEARYRTGQRVKHPTFGEGMIIESKGSGDDEIVVIAFEGTGIKRLAANTVDLKVLKG